MKSLILFNCWYCLVVCWNVVLCNWRKPFNISFELPVKINDRLAVITPTTASSSVSAFQSQTWLQKMRSKIEFRQKVNMILLYLQVVLLWLWNCVCVSMKLILMATIRTSENNGILMGAGLHVKSWKCTCFVWLCRRLLSIQDGPNANNSRSVGWVADGTGWPSAADACCVFVDNCLAGPNFKNSNCDVFRSFVARHQDRVSDKLCSYKSKISNNGPTSALLSSVQLVVADEGLASPR